VSWDEDNLYLAADVTDELLRVSSTCYKNGMQVGIEVGGSGAKMEGMLQAERSTSLDISRLRLLNVGLKPGQSSCSTALDESGSCCVQYENSAGGYWVRHTKVGVLRNENNKRTTFELAVAKADLIGTSKEHTDKWGEGLTFGFSFLVNDGDDTSEQQGWAGYYPHALVEGWNNGDKQPWKAGRLVLGGADAAGGGGGGGGSTWFGIFLGVGLTIGGLYLRGLYLNGAFKNMKLPALSTPPIPSVPRFGGGGSGGGGGLAASDAYRAA